MPERLLETAEVETADVEMGPPRHRKSSAVAVHASGQVNRPASAIQQVSGLEGVLLCALVVWVVAQPLLLLVSFTDLERFDGPVRVFAAANLLPVFMFFAPVATMIYVRTLHHGARVAYVHSVSVRGHLLLSGHQLKHALRRSTRTPWIEDALIASFTLGWVEYNICVASFGHPRREVLRDPWLYIALILPLILRFLFKQQRKALVRRERAVASQYVRTRALPFAAVLGVQVYLLAYMNFYCLVTVPIAPVPEERGLRAFYDACDAIDDAYVSSHCNASWGWRGSSLGIRGEAFYHEFGRSLLCEEGGGAAGFWSPYRSRYDCCEALQLVKAIQARFAAASTGTLCCTVLTILYEQLLAVNEALAWDSLDRLARRPRVAIIVCLASLLALSIPISIGGMHGTLSLGEEYQYAVVGLAALVCILLFLEFLLHTYIYTREDLPILTLARDGSSRHESSLRAALMSCVASMPTTLTAVGGGAAALGGAELSKMAGEASDLVCGKPLDAALGVSYYMRVDGASFSMPSAGDAGVQAIVSEFERHGTDQDRECVDYVLRRRAGTSDKVFSNGNLCRDCDADGQVLSTRLDAEGRARLSNGGDAAASEFGMVLGDFVNDPAAKIANLEVAHVFALRLYTTAAFRSLNAPLRDTRPDRPPHGLPVTVSFIKEAIGKLRAVEASTGDRGALDLWRGMKNLRMLDEFMCDGGTELAPMSCTADLSVAVAYSLSPSSLLFKIHTKTFMQRGANLGFLSAFPGESERTYPPLTFLAPTGRTMEHEHGDFKFTVVEVEPFAG